MTKRLSAVVGEYVDKQTNQPKAEWQNLDIIGISKNNKEYMLLDPTVNLAGVLLKQNIMAANKGEKLSDMVMISIIEEQQQNNQQQGQQQNQGSFQNQQQMPQNTNNGGFQSQQQYNQQNNG